MFPITLGNDWCTSSITQMIPQNSVVTKVTRSLIWEWEIHPPRSHLGIARGAEGLSTTYYYLKTYDSGKVNIWKYGSVALHCITLHLPVLLGVQRTLRLSRIASILSNEPATHGRVEGHLPPQYFHRGRPSINFAWCKVINMADTKFSRNSRLAHNLALEPASNRGIQT